MTTALVTMPSVSAETGLAQYLQQIRRFPMLEPEQEYILAKQWAEHGDRKAAHQLVTSHLRLVVKIAYKYKGYGLPMNELIAEGNIGLMQGVKKFDPEKGFRLSTYAMWWIKAAIQEYILHSWSLVKIGTTAAQKKLFFNLRKLKNRMQAYEENDLTPAQAQEIAQSLDVSEREVMEMNGRLSTADHSLNTPMRASEDGDHWQDMLVDSTDSQAEVLEEKHEVSWRRRKVKAAMEILSPREKEIFIARRLQDTPLTLEDLSQRYQISRERVRQIENKAFEKVQKAAVVA